MVRADATRSQKAVLNSGDGDKCPVCGGTGWETYFKTTEIYGEEMAYFARPCERCGKKRRSEDFTGVPPQFRDGDVFKFDFGIYSVDMEKIKKVAMSMVNDFKKWQLAGKGLYLWSKTPGSGKSFLACCIAKSIMIKYELQMRFVTSPDYLSMVSDSYKRERGECDASEVYRSCKVLVMDDLGAQKKGEWQEQELYRIIDKRLSEGNITLLTSNLPPERLNLEDRTIDRITRSCVIVQMPEEGIRAKKAREEQDKFLRSVVAI